MQRREALRHISLLFGGVAIAPEIFANALAHPDRTLARLPAERVALLAEMADTILPNTDTPGAKAAKVQDYIAIVVEECLPPAKRDAFWQGLEAADKQCVAAHGKSFVDCSATERANFFTQLQAAAKKEKGDTFWTQLKGLTLSGYFTSEIGATQALAYDPIPGGWVPDMKVDNNTKAWTPMF
jgi:hypothetical protein